jgi:hypothetical protein
MAQKGLPPLDRTREKQLRRLHALGEKVRREIDRGQKSVTALESAARREELSPRTMFRVRKFAESCSPEELTELCRLGLGWGHVGRLLTVQNVPARRKLAALASMKGWTSRQLWEEIQIRQGRRRLIGGGRGFRKPSSDKASVEKLLQLTESWIRFHDRVVGGQWTESAVEAEFPLPEDSHEETLQRLRQSLKGLHHRTGKVLRRLQPK